MRQRTYYSYDYFVFAASPDAKAKGARQGTALSEQYCWRSIVLGDKVSEAYPSPEAAEVAAEAALKAYHAQSQGVEMAVVVPGPQVSGDAVSHTVTSLPAGA